MNRNARAVAKPMTLVVVEDGTTLPKDLGRADGGFYELVVVAQDRVTPTDLVLRVARNLASFEQRGRRLERAMLVVGDRSDASADAARCLIARSLAAHLAASSNGELEIVCGQGSKASRRHELLALAGVLTSEAPSNLSVSVRFEPLAVDEALPSGVYPRHELDGEPVRRAAH
jgi:hypothetical protein